MDLSQGFHQIPVAETSRDLTTFVSPFGRYRFVRMPFGLKNAPAIFQRMMEQVLEPCRPFSACYIDDVIIFSNSWEEPIRHLQAVFVEFEKHNLTVKPSKCSFGLKHIEYLGHVIGEGKLAVPQHRIKALQDFKQLKTVKDMRAFLGTMSYYRRFIPGFANFSSLLSSSISKKATKVVVWMEEMVEAFHGLKVCEGEELPTAYYSRELRGG